MPRRIHDAGDGRGGPACPSHCIPARLIIIAAIIHPSRVIGVGNRCHIRTTPLRTHLGLNHVLVNWSSVSGNGA